MDLVGQDESRLPLAERPISVSAVFEDSEAIAFTRGMARDFLESLQAVHGLRPLPAHGPGGSGCC